MTNFVTRVAVLLFAALMLVPAAHAAEGSRIALEALPDYVDRVFVPVVPQATNRLQIDTLRAEQVVAVPQQFDVRVVNGGFVVFSDGGDAAGYARVRAGGRELTLTLVNVVPYSTLKAASRPGLIDGQTYLAEVLRYVVLNPVRAKMVARPEDYRWSSYHVPAGNRTLDWFDPGASAGPFRRDQPRGLRELSGLRRSRDRLR